jgi:hypothetical protein
MTSQASSRSVDDGGALRTADFERAAKVMIGQLAELMASPDGDFRRPPRPGHQRGIDYYSAKDLVLVVAASAAIYHDLHGVYPNLTNPVKLTEKIFWAKLFRPMKVPESGNKLRLADLISDEARSLVEIPEVVWRSTEARLPVSTAIDPGTYYLKTNHGSDMFRRIEWPPDDADRRSLEEEFTSHLANDFGYRSGEWWYLRFRREIFLERSVTKDPNSIAWYCYTFGERVARIVAYRKTPQRPQSFWLNPDFTPVERQSVRNSRTQFDLPSAAVRSRMVEAARAIGRRYSFVRVDFLLGEDERLYLSELTFSPGNGRMRWPSDMDLQFGAMWNHEVNPRT